MRCIRFVSNPEKIIELLLQAGANINDQDFCGTTPLMHAIMLASHATFEKVLQHGAVLKTQDFAGRTAMFHAIDCDSRLNLALLINIGASLYHLDRHGNSTLHYAAAFANTKTMGILRRSRKEGLPMESVAVTSYFTFVCATGFERFGSACFMRGRPCGILGASEKRCPISVLRCEQQRHDAYSRRVSNRPDRKY